ncbi:hypothetical protein SAMD00019534_016990 [Acytostelium subglobosum LB1]|uniref:hypothetical protein n=1 Tax=Acytostelium subglobosum LB1 TaxID=1410327 RepID=UPI000644A39B|nr:hypothetical protein SAMD00019534_016990 [Acytostelium subglobosum LB1]GAM18524.1 hypothetical protein SAMD00019534_016990 [Acytostelium subglobosum LB1]|eukprot:XP_012757744.1 hypothetical protein SAMD00019534_016990 [Acytostelium subglobosum LB1]
MSNSISDTHSISSSGSKGSKKKGKGHSRTMSVEQQLEKENEKVHKRFNLDPSNVVITTIKCSIKGHSGKLYVTESHLCFISKMMMKEKKKIIPFSDILEVENDSAKQVVKLVRKNGKTDSLHFKEHESAYLLLEGQWEASGSNQKATRLQHSDSVSSNLSDSGSFGHLRVKHFNLPETESLIKDYRCAHKGTFNQYGKLYLSQHYICFYSSITSLHKKTAIKLKDVVSISMPEKSKSSIQIDTKTETFVFTKFNDKRETVYQTMQDLYETAKNLPTPTGTPLSRSRSNSIDQGQDQGGLAPRAHFRRMSTSEVPSSSSTTTNNDTNGSNSNNPSRSHSRRNSVQTPTTVSTSPSPKLVTPTPTPPNEPNKSRSSSLTGKQPTVVVTPSHPLSGNNYNPPTNNTTATTAPAQPQPQPKISQRLDNIESVSPTPKAAPSNNTKMMNTSSKPGRGCCFIFPF